MVDDGRLLRLDPRDNVLIARQAIPAGESLQVGTRRVTLAASIPLGFKIAGSDLHPGEKVIKYGVSIGSVTAEIAAGESVHLHNMKSDYLPTYTREEERKYGRA